MIDEIIRICITFVCGFIIGLERQIRRKSIGFGSFTLVAIGSATLTIIGETLFPGNFLLILSGLISSIGFLGAGALFRTPRTSYGFTTASTLWTIAVFGITVGLGFYPYAALVYGLIWAILITDRLIERRGKGGHAYSLTVVLVGLVNQDEVKKLLLPLSVSLLSMSYSPESGLTEATYAVSGNLPRISTIMLQASQNPQLKSIRLT